MSKKEKSDKDRERKPSASPVCYLDQFSEYFEGGRVKPDTDDATKKDIEQSPEP